MEERWLLHRRRHTGYWLLLDAVWAHQTYCSLHSSHLIRHHLHRRMHEQRHRHIHLSQVVRLFFRLSPLSNFIHHIKYRITSKHSHSTQSNHQLINLRSGALIENCKFYFATQVSQIWFTFDLSRFGYHTLFLDVVFGNQNDYLWFVKSVNPREFVAHIRLALYSFSLRSKYYVQNICASHNVGIVNIVHDPYKSSCLIHLRTQRWRVVCHNQTIIQRM